MELIRGDGRPKEGYYIDKKRIPSVTTVIGSCKSDGTTKALMHWAWKLGKEGVDYRERQKSAMGSGHIAHNMAEHFIKKLAILVNEGIEYDDALSEAEGSAKISIPTDADPSEVSKAKVAFEGFVEWMEMTKAVVVATEVSLVSRNLSVGGTLDAVLKVNDKLYIGDWKTSNSLYADYLCQIAAYRLLWEECYPQYPINGGFHLVRFDKEYGDFEHRFFRNLNAEEEAFKLMNELYPLMRKVERRVR
jgi:hypothetical protein